MTYIPTRSGWLYLAVLIDLATRGIVGWATSASLATPLPLMALQQAVARRRPAPGLIHHTDRGCQYASGDYRDALAGHQMIQSMSRQGDCWDNAVAESFFATLEHELLTGTVFHSHREARAAIYVFIEHWYNPDRLHSTLQYMSPQQYEEQLRQMARAAQTMCPSNRVNSTMELHAKCPKLQLEHRGRALKGGESVEMPFSYSRSHPSLGWEGARLGGTGSGHPVP